MSSLKQIPIREEFSDPQGKFENFDTYDQTQRLQLGEQTHVNVRTFVQDNQIARLNMFVLDQLTQSQLETLTQAGLEGYFNIQTGESWTGTGVTVSKQADRNNWRGMTMACSTGTNTATSVIID